ncbi:MAG TPA: preprotein translocase subunit SecG [Pseudobacteroides sp.]|nr:preprotein translocase subunit SecG [Pseudobacteroides sp.]
MSVVDIIVNVFHILLALVLIVVVLLQSGKQAGLSGSIAGGAETFFGKNKGRTIDALLSKWTAVAAILFLVTSIALELLLSN